MAKLTREEFLEKIKDYNLDDDTRMSLVEDITDSIVDDSTLLESMKNELNKAKEDYDSLKSKYIERFYTNKEDPKTEEFDDDFKEKIIDIKEV